MSVSQAVESDDRADGGFLLSLTIHEDHLGIQHGLDALVHRIGKDAVDQDILKEVVEIFGLSVVGRPKGCTPVSDVVDAALRRLYDNLLHHNRLRGFRAGALSGGCFVASLCHGQKCCDRLGFDPKIYSPTAGSGLPSPSASSTTGRLGLVSERCTDFNQATARS